MTLKQLEAFYCHYLRQLHHGGAAGDLSISSLSKRLTELEYRWAAPCSTAARPPRHTHRGGPRLPPQARQLLEAAAALKAGTAAPQGLSGRCTFGVGELTALTWLPKLVALVRQTHPALVCWSRAWTLAAHWKTAWSGRTRLCGDCRSFFAQRHRLTADRGALVWTASASVVGNARRMSPALLEHAALVTLPAGAAPRASWTTGCWPRALPPSSA